MKEKPLVVVDTECYRNFFLIMFRALNGKTAYFEAFVDDDGVIQDLDVEGVRRTLRNTRLVSFNGNHYDMPMIAYALKEVSCSKLKDASDAIITRNLKPWEFEDQFDVRIDKSLDHIDLIEVAPGRASLKIYGGRMHAPKMQDLPIEPDSIISNEQREQLRLYCGNDLQTTLMLYEKLRPQLELREAMSDEYGIDLRSKSDAQIAEAVIKHQVVAELGRKIDRPVIKDGTRFKYHTPAMVSFRTEQMQAVLRIVETAEFFIDKGKLQMPAELADLQIPIGGSTYRMGIGGLHSCESSAAHVSDDRHALFDHDVTSYYPSLILLNGWTPKQMGSAFTKVYRGIVERRIAAKRAGQKVIAEVLKIVVNGSFGKFGSLWSVLYSPRLLIQTTVTGQLALLMLIEALEVEGISVVSANTDGIVVKCPRGLLDTRDAVIAEWELFTGLETEATEYTALYSRDVNNYFALKKGGGYKTKGTFAAAGLQKNPTNTICTEAVAAFLEDQHAAVRQRVSILKTIEGCTDVRKFVTIRQVKGGAVKGDRFLGKAVRFYYALGEEGAIHYKSNGNTVARSEGACPLMELPDELPDDIEYAWYVDEAYRILQEVGFKHPRVDE